jgi:hypothetical protein
MNICPGENSLEFINTQNANSRLDFLGLIFIIFWGLYLSIKAIVI